MTSNCQCDAVIALSMYYNNNCDRELIEEVTNCQSKILFNQTEQISCLHQDSLINVHEQVLDDFDIRPNDKNYCVKTESTHPDEEEKFENFIKTLFSSNKLTNLPNSLMITTMSTDSFLVQDVQALNKRHNNGVSAQSIGYYCENQPIRFNSSNDVVDTSSCYGCIEGVNSRLGGEVKLRSSRSTTSAVDLAAIVAHATSPHSISNSLRRISCNSSVGSCVSTAFKEGTDNTARSASFVTTSRPTFPYWAHCNDSGFSSFSSCTYLPPPPPYRQKLSGAIDSFGSNLNVNLSQKESFSDICGNFVSDIGDFSTPTKPQQNLFYILTNSNVQNEKKIVPLMQNNEIRNDPANEVCNVNCRIRRSLSDSKYAKAVGNGNRLHKNGKSAEKNVNNDCKIQLKTDSYNNSTSYISLVNNNCAFNVENVNALIVNSSTPAKTLTETTLLPSSPKELSLLNVKLLPTATKTTLQNITLNNQNASVPIYGQLTKKNVETIETPHSHHSRLGGSLGGKRDCQQYEPPKSWYATTSSTLMFSLSPSMSTVSCPEYPEDKDKIQQLEKTQDIYPPQQSIDDNKESTSDIFNKVSELKSQCSLVEREKNNAEYRTIFLNAELEQLSHEHLNPKPLNMLNAPYLQSQQKNNVQQSQQQVSSNTRNLLHDEKNIYLPNKDNEMEKLRLTVQHLIADNEQKNIEISSLRNALGEHSKTKKIENHNYRNLSNRIDQFPLVHCQSQETLSVQKSDYTDSSKLDINAQLRKLLIDDEKEKIAHSSSFPLNLCNSVLQYHAEDINDLNNKRNNHIHKNVLGLRYSGMQPSTSSDFSTENLKSKEINSSIRNLTTSFKAPFWSAYSSPANSRLSPHYQLAENASQKYPYTSDSLLHNPASLNADIRLNSYRKNTTSPATTCQLAAELDELRQSEFQIQQLAASAFQTNCTLPRSHHNKFNSNLCFQNFNNLNSKASTSSNALFPVLNGTIRSNYNLLTGSNEIDNAIFQGDRIKRDNFPNNNFLESFKTFSELSDKDVKKLKHGRARSKLRSFFGKLTRSNSQEIRSTHKDMTLDFRLSKINGKRLTKLAPFSTITSKPYVRPTVQQFVDWNNEQVCQWFVDINFSQYVTQVKRYVQSGRHLLNMTNQEYEKELQIKSGLHKKRLKCFLNCIERNTTSSIIEPADRMDVNQIMLWLDNIGLPQFRDIFTEYQIDGQMLLCLAAQDLVEMQIVSALNHATFARAIQYLRSVDFCVHRLQKRFILPDGQHAFHANDVESWSHSCVVGWLKNIDLAEFTPNLMFSGICGALIVNEPTFTAESLAEVLQISAHKTLLRRHLTSHFNTILGHEVINQKKAMLAQPYVTYLSPSLIIRLAKKGFLSTRKKSRQDIFVEPNTFVCGIEKKERANDCVKNDFFDSSLPAMSDV